MDADQIEQEIIHRVSVEALEPHLDTTAYRSLSPANRALWAFAVAVLNERAHWAHMIGLAEARDALSMTCIGALREPAVFMASMTPRARAAIHAAEDLSGREPAAHMEHSFEAWWVAEVGHPPATPEEARAFRLCRAAVAAFSNGVIW